MMCRWSGTMPRSRVSDSLPAACATHAGTALVTIGQNPGRGPGESGTPMIVLAPCREAAGGSPFGAGRCLCLPQVGREAGGVVGGQPVTVSTRDQRAAELRPAI